MNESLWQLLQEEPSNLTCDECFAVMEYYADLLSQGGKALLPQIKRHLANCPSCQVEHGAALRRLLSEQEGEAHPARKREA